MYTLNVLHFDKMLITPIVWQDYLVAEEASLLARTHLLVLEQKLQTLQLI